MRNPRLYLSHDAHYDWLIAVEFGAVDDQLPEEQRHILSEQFCYTLDRPGGDPIGFVILDFSDFDIEDPELAEIWGTSLTSTRPCSASPARAPARSPPQPARTSTASRRSIVPTSPRPPT